MASRARSECKKNLLKKRTIWSGPTKNHHLVSLGETKGGSRGLGKRVLGKGTGLGDGGGMGAIG